MTDRVSTDELTEIFFQEAADLLADYETGLLGLEEHPDDVEVMNRIFRTAHTLKGNAGMLGFEAIAHFTHALEDLLDKLRNGRSTVTPELVDTLLASGDVLKALVARAREGGTAPAEEVATVADVQRRLKALLEEKATPTPPAQTPATASLSDVASARLVPSRYTIRFDAPPDLLRRGLDPSGILLQLEHMGEVERVVADASTLPNLASMDPEQCYLKWEIVLTTTRPRAEVEACFDFVADAQSVGITAESPSSDGAKPARGTPSKRNASGAKGARRSKNKKSDAPLTRVAASAATVWPGQRPAEKTAAQAVSEIRPAAGESPRSEAPAAPRSEGPAGGDALVKTAAGDPGGATRSPTAASAAEASIRVPIAKVDRLINLVGELVITQSMVAQAVGNFTPDMRMTLEEAVADMDRHARELHEQVLAIRMLPIKTVFGRFPRLVRDLAAAAGKAATLEIAGEETELDKTVIEKIGDPLTHLMRNALDHGLETSAERTAAGKPAAGRVRLEAYQQGGSIYIEVEDDGRGLDRQRIVAKAIERGLVAPGQSLTDDEASALIFHPGLSTAEQVTEVSGRGVGMDVVRRNVEELGGAISIRSEVGRGTRFRIKLPLTLAIMDGQALQVGAQVYIIPLVAITESVRPAPGSLHAVGDGGEIVMVRARALPLVRLARLFGTASRIEDPTKGLVVIVEHEGRLAALLVDELLGQQQVVIKSLETNFKKMEGIAGATILGDGQVALILDVAGLVTLGRSRSLPAAA
jgi:two-component system chemotaxis sensor kinase CheA